jgi:secondary thiamine-phosphate synthase enzyme
LSSGRSALDAWALAFAAVIWIQEDVQLPAVPRGFHLVTREVEEAVPGLSSIGVGVAHVFIRHTSASLAINENASRDVLRDFATWFDRAVPDGASYFSHTLEGPDDMPAHIKSALLDTSLTIPVSGGRLALGTWQGIYLCEHRDSGGPRSLTVTAWGEERAPS